MTTDSYTPPVWPDALTEQIAFERVKTHIHNMLLSTYKWTGDELHALLVDSYEAVPLETVVFLGQLISRLPAAYPETLQLAFERVREYDAAETKKSSSRHKGHLIVPMIAENPSISSETLQECLYYHVACWTEVVQNPAATSRTLALALDLRTTAPEAYEGEHADIIGVMLKRTKNIGLVLTLPKASWQAFQEVEMQVLQLRDDEVQAWLQEHHPEMIGLPLEWVRGLLAVKN